MKPEVKLSKFMEKNVKKVHRKCFKTVTVVEVPAVAPKCQVGRGPNKQDLTLCSSKRGEDYER